MNIGLVLPATPNYSETFFVNKIKGLQENGYSVILFVGETRDGFSLCKVLKTPKVFKNKYAFIFQYLYISITLLPYFKKVLRFVELEKASGRKTSTILKHIFLNSLILKSKLNWLHFGFTTEAIGSEHVAKAIGAKMAISFRGFDIAIFPLKHNNCYKLVWQNTDKVHTISNDLLEKAYDLGLSRSIPVTKITPAIDITKFKSNISEKVFSKKNIMLSVARIHWKKGFDDVLLALKILKENEFSFHYNIIGQGNTKDTERLQFLIQQLNLDNEVSLLGKKSKDEVIEAFKTSEIYIQYSISEGFCNAVIEAQSMGLVSVVSNAEGLSENIKHNITGFVIDKLNHQLLAKTLMQVIDLSDAEKNKMSNNAIQRVKENYNLEKQMNSFVEFYKNL